MDPVEQPTGGSRNTPSRSRWTWFADPLVLKLFVVVTALILGVLVPAVYVTARQHFESSLELKREETHLQGRVIALALEHQMLEGRRDLIATMIENFSDDPGAKRLLVVDHEGRVQLTNDPVFAGRVFATDSPTCRVCHAVSASERPTSAVIELQGGSVLRSVYPLRNRPDCHRCHDPEITINGVMLTDTDMTDVRRELRAQIEGTAVVGAVVVLFLLVGVTFTVRLVVLGPLERIKSSTRAIGAGDFSRRVETTGGRSVVASLGDEFNTMADSVESLLGQLRWQRAQLENVMNSVDDGLLVVDRTLTVMAANKSVADRIGTTHEELLYRRCAEFWRSPCDGGDNPANEPCPARLCFATGRLHKSVRTRQVGDTVREEEVFASPIVGPDGQVEQVVEVWRDITERKSREAKMAEFQRLVSLGTLASGFSHEMNTPLGTMLVRLDEVRRRARTHGEVSHEVVREDLDLIRSEVLRCRDLTQQFLQLSRGRSLQTELLELPPLVRGTIPLMAHVAADAGVTVRVVDNPSAPVTTANGGAVRQVLLNILLNAVQASPRGGEVRIAWSDDGAAWIRVEDDGDGMSSEVRAKIFEPFFSRRPSGTGLGLFVSLNLARQWGGDIHVTSVPGHGSTFEVTFPPVDGSGVDGSGEEV